MKDLKDKIAVVTGAASGIGLGLTESFVAAGMKVVLADVEVEALEKTCSQLLAAGANIHGVVTDVSKPDQVDALADQTLRRYGAVHVLCNNAGVGAAGSPSWNTTLDEWNWVLGVNLMGAIHGIKAFLPIMIEQDSEAHIVNTASLAGLTYGSDNFLPYTVSKFGIVALSEGTYLELVRGGYKPRVSLLCPGLVNTNIINAARNRPVGVKASVPRSGPDVEKHRQAFAQQLKAGLDPRQVGNQVVAAIQEQRFYVLTHPHWQPVIAHRAQSVTAGANPSFMMPPEFEALVAPPLR